MTMMSIKNSLTSLVFFLCLGATGSYANTPNAEAFSNYATHDNQGRSVLFTTVSGQRLRITAYGNYIVRVQSARRNEEFFPDSRYEMVESHEWEGVPTIAEHDFFFNLETAAANGISILVKKNPTRLSFLQRGEEYTVLSERDGIW